MWETNEIHECPNSAGLSGQKREIILHEDEMVRPSHKTIREQKVKGHN